MYTTFESLKAFRIETAEGSHAEVADVIFDRDTMTVKSIIANGGKLFHNRSYRIPTSVVSAVHSLQLLNVTEALDHFEVIDHRKAEWSGPIYGDPIPGVLYPNWRRNANSWLTREIDAVIEHHKRYAGAGNVLLKATTLQSYSFNVEDLCLGSVSDLVLETKEWLIPYFVIQRTQGGSRFLCPSFLIHSIDPVHEKLNACIGPTSFEHAPSFEGDLSHLEEDKLWHHYLQYYGQELRRVTGATHGADRS